MIYPDNEKVKDSLQRYFDFNHFNNGGYDDKTFTIQFWGPFKLVFPNIKARVDAVKLHDIHHILTQYKTTLKGEAEIGAWELGAGCRKYWAAWLLNSGAIAYGFVLWPRSIYKGFMWGRRSKSLCHHDIYKEYNEELLSQTVGGVRSQLNITGTKNMHPIIDNLLFFLLILVVHGGMLMGLGLFALVMVYIFR